MMNMKNDFKELCSYLEKCNQNCNANPIKCVKHHLSLYIKGDYDMLLKIKAEAGEINSSEFLLGIFSMLGLAVSSFSLYIDIAGGDNIFLNAFVLGAYLFLLLELMRKMKQSSDMRKWQNYVLIVLEEMEDEMTKK